MPWPAILNKNYLASLPDTSTEHAMLPLFLTGGSEWSGNICIRTVPRTAREVCWSQLLARLQSEVRDQIPLTLPFLTPQPACRKLGYCASNLSAEGDHLQAKNALGTPISLRRKRQSLRAISSLGSPQQAYRRTQVLHRDLTAGLLDHPGLDIANAHAISK